MGATDWRPVVPRDLLFTGRDTVLREIRSGKEAVVSLVQRDDDVSGRSCLLALKQYRDADHRLFKHADRRQVGNRRRGAREIRALRNRSSFGRQLAEYEWVRNEFDTLKRCWESSVPVPYPISAGNDRITMEFVGSSDGHAAPQLVSCDASNQQLEDWYEQCLRGMVGLASVGIAHGDLSPYNILVHDNVVRFIDFPQAVDVVRHPEGFRLLDRDIRNVTSWFSSKGMAPDVSGAREQVFAAIG